MFRQNSCGKMNEYRTVDFITSPLHLQLISVKLLLFAYASPGYIKSVIFM